VRARLRPKVATLELPQVEVSRREQQLEPPCAPRAGSESANKEASMAIVNAVCGTEPVPV
jgi:hypothetical protein